jgi:hypothetical protein
MGTKKCTKCHQTKQITEFYRERRSADCYRTDCKTCSEARRRARLGQLSRAEKKRRTKERREKHAQTERAYSKARRERYRANELIRLARVRAKKKNLPFNLDEYAAQLTERVNRNVCEMTGIALQRKLPKEFNTPSLDRVDPSRGYVYDNVRVICYALNCALGTWGEDRLLEMVATLNERRQ